jgi:aspartate/methionine/tyrosine aminotransferase
LNAQTKLLQKLAIIPTTGFCNTVDGRAEYEKYIRVCFFKLDSTLDKSEAIFKQWLPNK